MYISTFPTCSVVALPPLKIVLDFLGCGKIFQHHFLCMHLLMTKHQSRYTQFSLNVNYTVPSQVLFCESLTGSV